MTTQLKLIQTPKVPKGPASENEEIAWKLDPETIALGFEGIAEARKALQKGCTDVAA
jgi:hypothetical protein